MKHSRLIYLQNHDWSAGTHAQETPPESEWQFEDEHTQKDEQFGEKGQHREAGEYVPVQLAVPDLGDEVGEQDAAAGMW